MINNNKNFIRSLLFFYTLVFFLAFSNLAYAALDSWSSRSAWGGVVQSIAVDPNTADTLYAATASNGIYKSTDGGVNWVHSSDGLDFLDVQVVAVDPLDSNQVLAGTNGGGIYRSTDAGATWTAINTNLINLNVYAIVFDPNNANNMYAATFGNMYSSTHRAEESVDWTIEGIRTGLDHNAIQTLAAAPGTPELMYLGTHAGGAFASDNSGGAWDSTNIGLTTLNVKHLTVASSGNLYAGTQGGGFFIGTPTTPTVITWTASNSGLTLDATINSIVESANDTNILYVASHNNVYRSADAGANWSAVGTELSGVQVLSLAIDYNTAPNETIYAGTTQGVYKLTEGSTTWTQVNSGITALKVTKIVIDPNDTTLHYAATQGSGILRSNDSGTTWSHSNNGLGDLNIHSIALDGSNIFIGSESSGAYRSLDGGNTWATVNNGLGSNFISHIADDSSSSDVLYAGTPSGMNITSNGGALWQEINGDITDNHDLKVQSLAIDPASATNRRIYISTQSSGIFYSLASSIAWTNISLGLDNEFIYSIAIDPNNTDTLYAGTRGSGVYKSVDRGASWAAVNTGIRATNDDIIHINTLVIDPNNSNVIYAGTETRGVYRSTNGGSSWVQNNTALNNLSINTLTIEPTASTVFAGTNGSGIVEIDFSSSSNTAAPQTFQSDNASDNNGGSGSNDYLLLFVISMLTLIHLLQHHVRTRPSNLS